MARASERGMAYHTPSTLLSINMGRIKMAGSRNSIWRVSDRKILYHEHCGKMDDPKYIEDMLTRGKDYSLEDILLGDRLFYTFESDTTPLDVAMLDMLIKRHYR